MIGAILFWISTASAAEAPFLPSETVSLAGVRRVSVAFEHAQVEVVQKKGKPPKRPLTTIELELREGSEECIPRLEWRDDGDLWVASRASDGAADWLKTLGQWGANGKPKHGVPRLGAYACKYHVRVEAEGDLAASVYLRRGDLDVEGLKSGLSAEVGWGDVSLEDVTSASVRCGLCDVSGIGVTGPVQYSIVRGNVGLSAISGSVEGKTEGDAVLHWDRVHASDHSVLSQASGDILLGFPRGAPVAVDAKVARGEVRSSKEDRNVTFYSEGNGAGPHVARVEASTKAGNVLVYRGQVSRGE